MGFSQYSSLFALVLCLLFVGQLNIVHTSFVETIYTATLTPQQVQPDNGITDLSYNAAVICEYLRSEDPIQLDCEIQHNVGSNATSIQIKRGARGVNGPLIFRFNSVLEHVRNTFTFQDTEDFTAEDLEDDFLNGQFYIQVNSDSYPGGIIRGQIEHKDRAYARLNAQNTIPSSSGTTATGIALATYSFYSPANLLQIDVVHNIVDPTNLDLAIGESNQIGDVAYTFTNSISPVFDSVSLTITEKSNFFNDLLYLNFQSESNPTGDIRGALVAIDYPFTMSYTAELKGSSEFTGGALISYNCDTQLLEYLIIHNIPRATGAFLGQGSSSSDGTSLFSLSTGESPIYGSLTLPTTYLSSLTSKQLYLQVVKGSDSSANIKGQITGDLSIWSYLSGTNELPAISTNNEGLALFTAGKDSNSKRQIQYQIYHSVPRIVSIDIRIGSEGNTGPVIASLEDLSTIVNGKNVTSPLTGSFSISSSDYTNYFLNSAVYIEITTKDYPLGLLRGQINELAPCVPNDSPQTVPTNSYNVLTYFDSFYPTLSVVIIASSNAVVIGASFILMFLSLLLTI